ncbi:glycosyltransferase [Pseudarthrobacter sp. J64]|uniref:CgeB family protein n=1 Tax=Pseudarthrobacter sp. J64 TaxID=3116485 RepID=UPI002E804BC7|nr:glycosyltransferase [Pseudarthrobacter sp. J64]MEE2568485.1 glycosyltransferase [Pseudarthrobacter sp. J64]
MIIHEPLRGLEVQDFTLEYSIPSDCRDLVVGLTARYGETFKARGALISYEIQDHLGNRALPAGDFEESPRAGTYFYVNVQETTQRFMQPTVETIAIPPGAETIVFTGRRWRSGMSTTLHDFWIVPLDGSGMGVELSENLPEFISRKIAPSLRKPWERRFKHRAPSEPGNAEPQTAWSITKEIVAKPRGAEVVRDSYQHPEPRPAHKIRVALICDEFTYNSFAPEFESIALEPDSWQEQIRDFKPDLFLCESAWSGVNSKTRPWRGQIYASLKFQTENRTKLFEILQYCKSHNVPTVFWNKEDPTHFGDRVNDFVSTASKFDYVMTTAAEVVGEYRRFMPNDRVGVMQFAAQPRAFSPVYTEARSNEAVFAGAWYEVHQDRCKTMREGFQYVLDAGLELTIFDRNFASKEPAIQFPREYEALLRPSISHRETANLYRKNTFGLNFNTVTDSSTMFARRIFELAASGTLVISNHSPGIERIYGDDIIYFDKNERDLSSYTTDEISGMRMRALRTTLAGHTYRHRFEELLRFVGIPFTSSRPQPTMMVEITTVEAGERAIDHFNQNSATYSRLLLVVAESVATSQTGRFLTGLASRLVSVVSASLVRSESVPESNFLSTPDVIWVDPDNPPSRSAVEDLMIHGEYTHLPVAFGRSTEPVWRAQRIQPGMRIAAPDVVGALLHPDSVVPTLEIPR